MAMHFETDSLDESPCTLIREHDRACVSASALPACEEKPTSLTSVDEGESHCLKACGMFESLLAQDSLRRFTQVA
jgi:hypothetical protein